MYWACMMVLLCIEHICIGHVYTGEVWEVGLGVIVDRHYAGGSRTGPTIPILQDEESFKKALVSALTAEGDRIIAAVGKKLKPPDSSTTKLGGGLSVSEHQTAMDKQYGHAENMMKFAN